MNNLPEDYSIVINSGLGSSMPREIIVLPVYFNGRVEGAIEFSSFKNLDDYKVQFLEKTAEYIGSFIAQTRINEQIEKVQFSSFATVED